jgi:histidine triad (HIT) family protein
MECIFCKIINKELPAAIKYEDDEFIAFDDIHPRAPVHIIIIPKEHRIKSAFEISEKDLPTVGRLIYVAKKIAEKKNLLKDGYRLTFNVGDNGGTVIKDHIHLHLLGGKKLGPEG